MFICFCPRVNWYLLNVYNAYSVLYFIILCYSFIELLDAEISNAWNMNQIYNISVWVSRIAIKLQYFTTVSVQCVG